jgi:hypothetical protein
MRIESLHALPALPPSEVEWEDLLLRLELMPRALRVVLEDLDPRLEEIRIELEELAEREAVAARCLERAAGLPEPEPQEVQTIAGSRDGVDRFVRLRTRNFALVQRRGVDVWEWEAPVGGGRVATVYQILTFLARGDVDALASIRDRSRSGPPAC